MIGIERLRGIDVDRRAKPAGQHELGQRVEVDHVSPADEDEHRVGPHALEQLAGEQRLVLARRRREHEDDARGLEQMRKARRLDAPLSQVRVGEPRVVGAELTPERSEQLL